MSKKQWINLVFAAIVAFVITALSINISDVLAANKIWVWASVAFLLVLFSLVNYVLFNGMTAKSQQQFMLFFAMAFGVKVFGTLAWLVIILFIIGFKDFEFVGLFFALYFLLTFLLMAEVWVNTKRK